MSLKDDKTLISLDKKIKKLERKIEELEKFKVWARSQMIEGFNDVAQKFVSNLLEQGLEAVVQDDADSQLKELMTNKQVYQKDKSPCCHKPMIVFASNSYVMCSGCRSKYDIDYQTGYLKL